MERSALPLPPLAAPGRFGRGDAKLARAAARGDERAFAAIYDRYHQELYRYCRAILGNADEAQDALQSTMASALRALPGESRTIELRAWLYRVAHNEAVSIVRRRTEEVVVDEEWRLPSSPSADDAFEARERLRSLVADLSALPERQRSALVMLELSGLKHEEIAVALGVSPGAARQLVYEARVALQELGEGRAMECERVRTQISDGDGRVLRGRKLRAHLKSCAGCAAFNTALETRPGDLGLIAPPLSAAAASSVLASVLGGSAVVGAGTTGGLLGGGILGGGILGAKSLGVLAVSAAVGVGIGTAGGVDLPGVGSDSERARSAPASQDDARTGTPATSPGLSALGVTAGAGASNGFGPTGGNGSDEASGGRNNSQGNANAKPAGNVHGQGAGNAHGQASGIPAHANGNAVGQQPGNGSDHSRTDGSNRPASPPGQSDPTSNNGLADQANSNAIANQKTPNAEKVTDSP